MPRPSRRKRIVRQRRRRNTKQIENENNEEQSTSPTNQPLKPPYDAYNYQPSVNYSNIRPLEGMTIICPHCNALRWKGESANICCSGGKVKLLPFDKPPTPLAELLTDSSVEAIQFRRNIRSYNNAFAMTSFGISSCSIDNRANELKGYPTFRIQGQICHRIGSLISPEGTNPHFIQAYFYGTEGLSVEQRNINSQILLSLRTLLRQHNPYVKAFRCASEKPNITDYSLVIRADLKPTNAHIGVYNAPIVSEVAIVYRGEENASGRDIVIESRANRGLKRVWETHQSYDPLQYPLMFWNGANGYSIYLPLANGTRGYITCADYYAYRLMCRNSDNDYLLRYGYLLNQFLTDMGAKVESGRLDYLRHHQKELRAEEYGVVYDDIHGNRQIDEVGQAIILPPNYQGSPRHMHQYRQDAMAYVRRFGNPDLFITLTCNKSWQEITSALLPGQKPDERHDIISRVFHLKIDQLWEDITKHNFFGPTNASMYTVEWQKRGLPHIHMLIWLKDKVRLDQIDYLIRAEIPNAEEDPLLYQLVTTCMMHGPCGNSFPSSVCMRNGKCTKQFPKDFCLQTSSASNSYPKYRRLPPTDGGQTFNKTIRGNTFTFDNRWVVPYSPVLLRKYGSHINVEICHSVRAIKYLTKYITKGSDRAMCRIGPDGSSKVDEIANYIDGRYLSSNEAAWRIFKHRIHRRWPAVEILQLHLENGQRIYYRSENAESVLISGRRTKLTAFFELCQNDSFARTILYSSVPEYYTWQVRTKIWQRRVRGEVISQHPGIRRSHTIGRLVAIHPNRIECFYLRLLLTHVKGPRSFEDLRTVDGTLCSTYRDACLRLNLIHDDNTWDTAMREAVVGIMPYQLRRFFAVLLSCCEIPNPLSLWNTYKDDLSLDFVRNRNVSNEVAYQLALTDLSNLLQRINGSVLSDYGLPSTTNLRRNVLDVLVERELDYDVNVLRQRVNEMVDTLSNEQKDIYTRVMKTVVDGTHGLFFLSAPGGTGKTYLINIILDSVRSMGKIALATASTGIASTLLTGGRTAHSMLKLPLRIDQTTCNISKRSITANLIRKTSLIVLDEATMIHKSSFEALSYTLKDIKGCDLQMGGISILLCGDFRQTLPVVKNGIEADMINQCIKRSSIWNHIEQLTLTKNLRVCDDVDCTFQKWLLDVGDGKLSDVNLSSCGIHTVRTPNELIKSVYGETIPIDNLTAFLNGRAILAPLNETVREYNSRVLFLNPNPLKVIMSADSVIDVDDSVNYPIEVLQRQSPSHLALHKLELKVGSPVMVLRNLDPPRIVNGTRFVISSITNNLLTGIILNGPFKGEPIHLPRIHMYSRDDLPIEFKRTQFPVTLCYAITINKSQGQTFEHLGIDLSSPCFSHGQLYVALSRVTSKSSLHVLTEDVTTNIVHRTIL